jgi:nucleotidyltransferase/DNA polymerase involved in DNA repair
MALYIPFLSTDRLRSAPKTSPAVTIAQSGGVMRIIHISAEARDLRIRPGQTLADAKALAPQLITFPDDPAADRRALETLAAWADRFSPVVHIEGHDTLILDVTGAAHLFGNETKMLARALEGLASQGFTARGTVADTAGAAWTIAHAHPEPAFISRAGRVVEDIVSLPVWSLRIDEKVVQSLHRVGVDNVASLLHLPRSSLAARFGDDVLTRIDQALGDVPEVLTPYRPRPVLCSEVPFGGATDRLDLVLEGVRRALEMLCEKLTRQVAGASEVFVTFVCQREESEIRNRRSTKSPDMSSVSNARNVIASPPQAGVAISGGAFEIATLSAFGGSLAMTGTLNTCRTPDATRISSTEESGASAPPDRITLPLTLSQPTRSVKHLFSLARVALERVRLPGPVEVVSAWTPDIEPLDDWQNELFNTDESDERELAGLIDRLAVRLGSDAVVSPQPVEDHQPERAYCYATCTKDAKCRAADRRRETNNRSDGRRLLSIDNRQSSMDCSPSLLRAPSSVALSSVPMSLDPSPSSLRPSVPPSLSSLVRPLRLLPEPVPLAVTALYPEGPPVSFSLRGRLHVVGECAGPERIETGWWRGPHVRRDYYRITTRDGARAWIFRDRDAGEWLLHGWFD